MKEHNISEWFRNGHNFPELINSAIKNYLTKISKGLLVMIFIISVSCQKVIDLNLKNSAPQLVVEANIFDTPGPYIVKLSNTVDFDNITSIPFVSGAEVEISDSAGIHEVLTEATGGIYLTNSLTGLQGHKYTLTVKTGGKTYRASSVMPFQAANFRLSIKKETEEYSGFGSNQVDQPFEYLVSYAIDDPPGFTNYYRLVIFHNDREISSFRVFSDEYHNGKVISYDFHLHDTSEFMPGDKIQINLLNIDKNTYNFFRTLREGASGLSFLSASPSNPVSNISDDGLGYFSASSVVERYLTIPY